jgi:sigma-E factor negative regulatory protein RseC
MSTSTEEGTITKITGNKAQVLVRRSEMCNCCGSRSVCHTLGGGKNMEAEALNTAGGKVGDRVLLKLESKAIWKISVVFYVIPVVFLVLGAVLGMEIGKNTDSDPEMFSALFGILAAGLSFFVIKLIANRLNKNQDYFPEIVKIVSPPQKKTKPVSD